MSSSNPYANRYPPPPPPNGASNNGHGPGHGHVQHPIPDIPGQLISPEHREMLQSPLREIIPGYGGRFPGAQPVSMTLSSLAQLERQNFWVCEKTDGVRVLLLILWNEATGRQDCFLIDRKNDYRIVEGLFFPHHDPSHQQWCKTTLLDGELVLDWDTKSSSGGQWKLRYYAFDCLVYDRQNLMGTKLEKRYGKMQQWLLHPHFKMRAERPEFVPSMPFEIVLKPVELADGVEKVMQHHIPKLEHGHDGLIFTCADTPYVMGEDRNIMKWKPPNENSIDFKLTLRFPPSSANPNLPDLAAKPLFTLQTFRGGPRAESYVFFDRMNIDDEEWEEMKRSGEQYDERIVECAWDPERDSWRFMRFRDDKHDGNFIDIVDKIIDSIKDGVELPQLIERCPAIRAARKERAAQAAKAPPPQATRPPPVMGAQPGAPIAGGYGMGAPMAYGGGVAGGGLRR